MNNELKLFCEDVDEQLTFMENSLIAMQEEGPDEESIGALFRAMHTIKGTAGMFGFDDVVHFAHTAENLLSEVRDGKVKLTEEMIEIFLKSKDHAQTLVDLAVNNDTLDSSTQTTHDDLIKILQSMLVDAKEEDVKKEEVAQEGQTEGKLLWHISFRLKPNFFSTGMDIINILGFFKLLGEIKNMMPIVSNIPNLEKLNPTEAYMGYEIKFLTDVSYEEIQEIFEFILDDLELHIFQADDRDALKSLVDNSQDKDDLKELLISHKFYDISMFEEVKKEAPKNKEQNSALKDSTKKEKSKNFSLRVDSSKIDQLINKISEMVIANAKITQRADLLDDNDLSESATIMSDMLEEIRTGVMNIRMIQVGDSFNPNFAIESPLHKRKPIGFLRLFNIFK